MKIATWNVNSIKARLPRVLEWFREFSPDVALLQEVKCVKEAFPALEFEDIGYNIAMSGQKSYNGVAILTKHPLEIERTRLPGSPSDEQARYIEVLVRNIRIASIYLPNGKPTKDENGNEHEKFRYKLEWMDRLYQHAHNLITSEETVVFGGDFNVAPTDDDVYDPMMLANDAICRLESRKKYRAIMNLGLTDAYRTFNAEPNRYSYWDYKAGAWQKDNGVLIDHLLLTPKAADRLLSSGIDKVPRGKEKPSDHTPVWCELKIDIKD